MSPSLFYAVYTSLSTAGFLGNFVAAPFVAVAMALGGGH